MTNKSTVRAEVLYFKSKEESLESNEGTPIPTLAEVWADYLQARKIRPATIESYRENIKRIADWMPRPITSITRREVEKRHTYLTTNNGPGGANLTFRILRAVFNFAMARYDDENEEPLVTKNPVAILAQGKSWNKEKPRERYLKDEEFYRWHRALQSHSNAITSDFMVFLLYTGCRREEARKLEWRDVDFKQSIVTFRETKNHTNHVLPISSQALAILQSQSKNRRSQQFVFSLDGTQFQLKTWMLKDVKAACGIHIAPHDCRRSMASLANRLGIDFFTIKRLLNHAHDSVTSTYIMADPEKYRREVQRIGDRIQVLITTEWKKVLPRKTF